MVKIDVGGSQSRPATVPGTPRKSRLLPDRMYRRRQTFPQRVQKNGCTSWSAMRTWLPVKRITVEEFPSTMNPSRVRYPTARAKPRKCPQVSLARQPQMVSVHRAVCDLSRRLPRRLGQSTSQKADGEEEPKKDKFF